jgi:lactate dehydrogenase-like 2-hydroxyacid dehydrogenase
MTRVLVTRAELPGGGLDRLAARTEVVRWPHPGAPAPEELRALAAGVDGILAVGGDRIDAALLDAAGPTLKLVALSSMGYDSVDQQASRDHGVIVTNTPNVLEETTADLAFALILMARRRLGEASSVLLEGRWQGFAMDGFLGLDVHGAVLGLVGYGQIGHAVARRGHGFGMRVQHYSRSGRSDELSQAVDLPTLLASSDVVSLHVPLTADTRHLIGADELALMKPTATLVNTARGPVVDERALVDALRSGRLHSAGLDVFAQEPLGDSLGELKDVPGLVMLPHIGSATLATRSAMVDLAVDNLLAVLDGGSALTPIPGSAG